MAHLGPKNCFLDASLIQKGEAANGKSNQSMIRTFKLNLLGMGFGGMRGTTYTAGKHLTTAPCLFRVAPRGLLPPQVHHSKKATNVSVFRSFRLDISGASLARPPKAHVALSWWLSWWFGLACGFEPLVLVGKWDTTSPTQPVKYKV